MGATAVLCDFASRTKLSDFSNDAIEATKRHISDCTGVAIAAAAEPAGRILLDMTEEGGGAPQARVLGSSLHTSAVSAAWANGSLAHLLDYDDTGFSHPTAASCQRRWLWLKWSAPAAVRWWPPFASASN